MTTSEQENESESKRKKESQIPRLCGIKEHNLCKVTFIKQENDYEYDFTPLLASDVAASAAVEILDQTVCQFFILSLNKSFKFWFCFCFLKETENEQYRGFFVQKLD